MKSILGFLKPLRKENEALSMENAKLNRELNIYKRENKVLAEAVAPLTELGIKYSELSEALKPMFKTYIPLLKSVIEKEIEKQRQEAAFRSENRRCSSSI
ncbi:MAG: hypothetical protein WCK09_03380 [Bacteroidota bacterium]